MVLDCRLVLLFLKCIFPNFLEEEEECLKEGEEKECEGREDAGKEELNIGFLVFLLEGSTLVVLEEEATLVEGGGGFGVEEEEVTLVEGGSLEVEEEGVFEMEDNWETVGSSSIGRWNGFEIGPTVKDLEGRDRFFRTSGSWIVEVGKVGGFWGEMDMDCGLDGAVGPDV